MEGLEAPAPSVSRLGVPPYRLERVGTLMEPQPGDPLEAEGVLNPASARDARGRLWLFPRVVAAGNYSRIGRAMVNHDQQGMPFDVSRHGFALEPEMAWERNSVTAGVEDPRITTIPSLDVHVMTYTAFGPHGPRIALAVSRDLRSWQRLGPIAFGYEAALEADINLYDNKDAVFFPAPVPGPGGHPCFALLHRPSFDLPGQTAAQGAPLPRGVTDPRPGIWMSYVPVDEVLKDIRSLTRVVAHRPVAFSAHPWESLKIGAGTPPVLTRHGWLLIHHGVSGHIDAGVAQQQHVCYSAGAIILDARDPSRVTHRSVLPLLEPATAAERSGIVPDVVFPTAIDPRPDGSAVVFYGMADSRIGTALLTEMAT